MDREGLSMNDEGPRPETLEQWWVKWCYDNNISSGDTVKSWMIGKFLEYYERMKTDDGH